MKLGILADTATDTSLGKAFFEAHGFETVCHPVKPDSSACFAFFQQPPALRDSYILSLLEQLRQEGAETIVVYANSVCAYVDFDRMERQTGLPIFTPFHAYGAIARRYARPCVLAVTAAALSGIEARILRENPSADICGVYRLHLAELIEAGLPPEAVLKQGGLYPLLQFCKDSNRDSVILGCTHFSCLKTALTDASPLPILDPADILLQMLPSSDPCANQKGADFL